MRFKILRAARRLRHRHELWRALTMTTTAVTLLLVPLSGLARVDLWGGAHALWFRPATLSHGLAGVVLCISALYVVTFLSNTVVGRVFCGWGCPVGQISRFGESASATNFTRARRVGAQVSGALFTAGFVVAMLAWWTDLRVLWRGSPSALAWSWGIVFVGVALSWLHGRYWRWDFCKKVCPIGLYYSFVSPAAWFGVYFRNQESTCVECDACDNVCPVDLAPRDLIAPIPARGGLSIPDAPGRNHCLECGDCVRACEMIIAKRGRGPVPLLLGFHRGPKRIDPDAMEPIVESEAAIPAAVEASSLDSSGPNSL